MALVREPSARDTCIVVRTRVGQTALNPLKLVEH